MFIVKSKQHFDRSQDDAEQTSLTPQSSPVVPIKDIFDHLDIQSPNPRTWPQLIRNRHLTTLPPVSRAMTDSKLYITDLSYLFVLLLTAFHASVLISGHTVDRAIAMILNG